MRVPFIAGNWKMNMTHMEAIKFFNDFEFKFENRHNCDIAICPPFTALRSAQTLLEANNLKVGLGAQNMFYEESGAYTGEISPTMLKAMGIEYVIVGHSERREYFKETDQDINKKIKAAFNNGLKPILCIGESLDIRESGQAESHVLGQLTECLEGIELKQLMLVTVAYEPIWAIGTGKTATAEDANAMCRAIREKLASVYGQAAADAVRIQYGGSVKPGNISELMETSDIDGALVGGASLKVDDFLSIINY
ncbi:MAG: triose-phosphate isomerase [Actinomycetota bacterium]|nr:triose-phosphate isomerase [Actinomycetota bacterium]